MLEQLSHMNIYTDGGSRGNPGPAAASFVLTDQNDRQVEARGLFLGETTNNVAEYTGLVKALQAAKQIGVKKVIVFSDSELLVKQVNGLYKVKSKQLKPLFPKHQEEFHRKQQLKEFPQVAETLVPPQMNFFLISHDKTWASFLDRRINFS